MTLRILTYILAITTIIGCEGKNVNEKLYADSKQRLSVNEVSINGQKMDAPKLKIDIPSEIRINKETVFKIYPESNKYRLVEAYFDCFPNDSCFIDTNTFSMDICKTKVYIENDTIKFYFKPSRIGLVPFDKNFVGITKGIEDGLLRFSTISGIEYEVKK